MISPRESIGRRSHALQARKLSTAGDFFIFIIDTESSLSIVNRFCSVYCFSFVLFIR